MPFDFNSTAARSAIGAVLLLVGLIAGWFIHKSVSAPPDIPTVAVYQDWRIACPATTDKEPTCEIQQDVLDSKSHSELARFSIYKVKGVSTMVITLPYNILLEPGIGLALGNDKDKPLIYPFEVCNGVGCVVRIPFTDDLAKKIGSAPSPRILFAGLDQKPVGLAFSLKGYKDVIAVFNNTEAKRHSMWKRIWS